MKHGLLRKYFALAVTIVALFVVLGFFLTGFIARALRPPRDVKESLPPIFFAKILDNLNYKTKLEALQNFKSWHPEKNSPELVLLNEKGETVYPVTDVSPLREKINLADLQKLTKPYDYYLLKSFESRRDGGPPGPPGLPGLLPGGPGGLGMGFWQGSPVVRLSGNPLYYLVILPPQMRAMEAPSKMTTQERLIPLLGLGSLILSLLIGIGATLFLIYISVFKKIKEADTVLSELQKGNLKARFKIIRKDEFGEAMLRFNKMADEIENLVEQMKFVELARTKLLQELAHDLRTPIAALKSLLETLDNKEAVMDPKIKKEIIALSLRETSYFEHLIEDLLLLSQVNEPNYGRDQDEVNLSQLLTEEVADQTLRYQNDDKEKRIDFIKDIAPSNFVLRGNVVLLRRMLKNVFNNATSFAKRQIKVHLRQTDQFVEVVIEDDGPGFLPEQLQSFGVRKMSRQIIREKNNNERLSIGLGSVVIKKISELHRGQLMVENVQDLAVADQNRTGARITLRFGLN